VEPQQNKLKNSKATDHESDTNYKRWLEEPMPASGGKGDPAYSGCKRPGSSSKGMPASGGEGEPASGGTGWGALMGYSRHKDKVGLTHGWVQFGKHCVEERQKKVTLSHVPRVFRVRERQHRECNHASAEAVAGKSSTA
jgi:hypothetical protein